MQTFFLTVIRPTKRAAPAALILTLLRVQVSASLDWVRRHADEIALKQGGPGYVALMVHEQCPAELST